MDFAFPQFDQPAALDAQRAWTATFDSYDQRNDDVYYVVAIHEAEREVARFMVQVFLSWAGDDWTGPEFTEQLREELHRLAGHGKTNTAYAGAMVQPRL
jgi:hypothetical protein